MPKAGLPLIKNVIAPLAKSVLILLGLTAAASAADARIHKKILESPDNRPSSSALRNNTTTQSNNDIIKNSKIS